MEKHICGACEYWKTGIPTGSCRHPKALGLYTSDTMVFTDAGKGCPLNRPEYRKNKLKNVGEVISDLSSRCNKLGIRGAVVGISGGKDSTIVAKLMVEVLGRENVVGVLMPNGEQKDISDSKEVVKLLGIESIEINIGESFNALMYELGHNLAAFNPVTGLSDDAIINVAPRIRMTVLYAIAQSMGHGWRVIGTTNKSENYIGWLTKWGDGGVDFEPIIDFTVTELLEFGKDLGLPAYLVDKTPIDGLTDFSDEERIGFSYKALDLYLQNGTSGDKGIDSKIEKMHEYSEHKRNEIPIFKLKY